MPTSGSSASRPVIGAVVDRGQVVDGERRQLTGIGEPVDVADVGGDRQADELQAASRRCRCDVAAPDSRSTEYSVVPSAAGRPAACAGLAAVLRPRETRDSTPTPMATRRTCPRGRDV